MNSAVYFLESLTSSDEEDTQFMTMQDISPWFFVWQCLVDHQLLACLMALSCELCAWQNYIWMSCAVDLSRLLMVFNGKYMKTENKVLLVRQVRALLGTQELHSRFLAYFPMKNALGFSFQLMGLSGFHCLLLLSAHLATARSQLDCPHGYQA